MRECYKKIKSTFVVLVMLVAAFGVVLFGSVSATFGTPEPFNITAPSDGEIIARGISYNLTWESSDNATSYNLTIYPTNGPQIDEEVSLTTTYTGPIIFPAEMPIGWYNLSIYAYNETSGNKTYATNDNISFYITGLPGVNAWEGGNLTVGADVLNTSTEKIYYKSTKLPKNPNNNQYYISVNGSLNWGTGIYNLYYPFYHGRYNDGDLYNLTWRKYEVDDIPAEIHPPDDLRFGWEADEGSIDLNRSGLWLIGPSSGFNPDASNYSQMNSTIPAWFWVNTSSAYTLSVSDLDFNYDDDGEIDIIVKHGADYPAARLAIFSEYNKKLVGEWSYNAPIDGNESVEKNNSMFTWAGNWTVTAYSDEDLDANNKKVIYYEGNASGWNYYDPSWYGNVAVIEDEATYYSYESAGPWDPPEYNVSERKRIEVKPGEPIITLFNTTQYYSFDGKLEINVTDSDGDHIEGLNVTIVNDTGDFPGVYFGADTVAPYGKNKANSEVEADWTKGDNGTWEVFVIGDMAGDSIEEWNSSETFEVDSAPGLQIMVINDGDGDNDLEVPAGPPPNSQLKNGNYWNITFNVVNATHDYYGVDESDEDEAMGNITISGDACLLSGKTLEELNEIGDGIVTLNDRNWTVNLIPIMDTEANGGGEITISAEWEDHGGVADPVTIKVGGDDFNGTLVSITPSEITIAQNISLEVSVTSPTNPSYGYDKVRVYLYYMNDSGGIEDGTATLINDTLTSFGEATFHFNRTQQTENQTFVDGWSVWKANRYIIAYVKVGDSDYCYACAKLVPNHTFKATCEAFDEGKGDSPATSVLMAGRDYDDMYFNVSIVDSSTGNVTGYPTIGTGQDILHFRIYNETGEDVTDAIGASSSISSANLDITSGSANHSTGSNTNYIVEPGVYSVYAYNNTHDSQGNNGTLEVKQVEVVSSIEEFIWMYDDNISTTFTVTYEGEPVNGTLRVDNISFDSGADYNQTWANTSFDGTNDQGGNTSLELTKNKGFVNGVITIHNITANFLPGTVDQMNVTFWFDSDKSSSVYARAAGMVPVKIPDVTPTPASLAYNEPAELEILLTGRGTPLDDLQVNISIPGLTGEMWTRTRTDGIAFFAFTPPTTGDITIEVENRTSDVEVPVTAFKLYLDVDPEVDESSTFTVTVLNKTASGAAIAGAAVTFNRVTKTTDANGQAEFNAPSVTSDRDYTIRAKKEGYAEDVETITVVNRPKLVIVPPATAPSTGSTFQATIADDLGNAIIGATLTINNKAYISGAQGIVTVTAPTEKGDYTVVATKTGFQSSDPITITIEAGGIPGFEVLTLIAAIGVAFILLRRRRH